MKTWIRKWALVAIAALMLLSLPNLGTAADSTGGGAIVDGEYTNVSYTYLVDGTNEVSAANNFMQVIGSGRLVVTNGHAVFYHKIPGTSADWIKFLAYRKPGQPKATIVGDVVSNDGGYEAFGRTVSNASSGEVEVSLPVEEDPTASIDILMHVAVPPEIVKNYDHWYNVQLKLDTSKIVTNPGGGSGGETTEYTLTQLNELISASQAVYDAAVVGDAYGQYPEISKALFKHQINAARDAADKGESNPSGITPAYKALTDALNSFKTSVRQADKTALKEAMAKVQALYDKIQAAGELGSADAAARAALNGDADASNDVETYLLKAVTNGEYNSGIASSLKSALSSAQTALDNPTTPDTTVATRTNTLNSRYESNKEYYYRLASETLPIYILDNATSASAQSEYASDFAGVAYRLTNGKDSTEYANLPMNVANVSEAYASAPATDGSFELPQEGLPGYKAIKLVSFGDYKQPVYQVRSQFTPQTNGLSYLSYKVGEQKRTVYISYNYNELQRLNNRIAAAQNLHEKAQSAGTSKLKATSLAAEPLDALESAIDDAKQTGDNLAASRQQITQANVTLKTAVASFIENVPFTAFFTAAAAASEDFSDVGANLGEQADISAANEMTYAEFTVKSSSKVTAVRVNNGTSLVDAEVISNDAQNDTRRVKIAIPDLAALTTVQIVADGTTYDARLNFNDIDNKALVAKVAAAKSELAAAVVGTAAGQYPASAKTALEQAVGTAGKEATRLASTQALSDAAVQKLDDAIKTFRAAVHVSGGNPGTGTGTELTDGKYQISFTILKQGTTQASVMDEYVAHPGRMLVENGSKYVYIWLNKSKEITAFTVNGSSTETVTSDTAGNTRWVRFPVSDLTALQSGWVKIDWPEVNYFHQYDVQIKFGSYTKVAEWSGEGFGSVTPRPNPDGEEEESETDGEGGANGGSSSGGTDENLGAEFFDTAKHWAVASISRAVKLGIVNGYSDGNFRPNAAISRVEFAVLLGRALDLQGEEAELSFKDAADIRPWAQSFIKQAVAAGIIGGFEDGTFRPAKEISRPELAVMIVRALGIAPEANASLTFGDASQIPAYARPYVAAAVKLGLIQGGSNNLFGAKSPATRAEAITLVLRALDHAEADAKAKKEAEAAGAKAESEAAKA
ncbi:NEAT domain-containing protein [Cohnella sp. GCM10020058]|uniref:NEAT domain-containing protein n=1 Tax=Cohnella sp. GCM10020058 TaxID=3317330 RepID=UPI0036447546